METNIFFKDTFEYNWHCNQELLELFEKEQQNIPEKSIQLLNHLINAHQIWISRILEQKASVGVWEIQSLEELKNHNTANFNQSMAILKTMDLGMKINYSNSKGISFSNSAQDILFHVINHSTYHRAQITSDLKTNNIDPLNSDYIFYKRE
ncbi:damage-inducible protein DinB [Flavobacterium sp. L1I52]|uniref:Damage-inducible protein DinB n=1 Tax=Flavobacterium pokkalii TaxID=1940408 RepID=A0ABR7UST4_9FLAO|nr:DinB family protein [Flavobacterium pokkalii]MBD0724999.1 damage-inducible protein DinB [Flavobacterium pokkalii]